MYTDTVQIAVNNIPIMNILEPAGNIPELNPNVAQLQCSVTICVARAAYQSTAHGTMRVLVVILLDVSHDSTAFDPRRDHARMVHSLDVMPVHPKQRQYVLVLELLPDQCFVNKPLSLNISLAVSKRELTSDHKTYLTCFVCSGILGGRSAHL
jgi:hypothetical protein